MSATGLERQMEIGEGAKDTIIGNMEGGKSIRMGERELGGFTEIVQVRERARVTSATGTAKSTIIGPTKPDFPQTQVPSVADLSHL